MVRMGKDMTRVLGPEIVERVRKVRLMVFDVDGVLTDGSLIYLDSGIEGKVFDVQDGHGLKLLLRAGIEGGIISGRFSSATQRRAEELGLRYIYQNAKRKLDAYEDLLLRSGLSDEAVGYVGDDLVDIPLMRRVGWAVAVPNADPSVLPYAHYITRRPGGHGACREVCEIILKVQGQWEEVTRRYFD